MGHTGSREGRVGREPKREQVIYVFIYVHARRRIRITRTREDNWSAEGPCAKEHVRTTTTSGG